MLNRRKKTGQVQAATPATTPSQDVIAIPADAEEIEVKPLYAPRPPTVLCPLHRTPLIVQVEGNKKFAICQCDVPGNKHKGQVVWQKFI